MSFRTDRLAYSSTNCSIARTLEIVGDRWTLHVLREAFFGVRRFEDFHLAVGCARSLLSQRLSTLVEAGLLERVGYQVPGQRARPEYVLTDKGRDFFPVLLTLLEWGDRWTADAAGPAVELRHHRCGAVVHARLVCEAGHDELDATQIEPVAGAGARRT